MFVQPLLVACLVAGAAAVGLTRAWIAASPRLGVMDPPNPLVPQHRQPTATMGGVPLVVAVLLGWLIVLATVDGASADAGRLLPAGLGFLALGAVDDHFRFSAGPKLLAQIGLAVLAVNSGLVYPITGHWLVDAAATGLLFVTMVNAVNLTDVCDGLVAGLSAIALGAAAVLWPGVAGWAAPTSAAALGFLLFNAPRARVFLGDAGSHWFGFLLVALPVIAVPASGHAGHALQAGLLAGVFLFELASLFVARLRQGLPVWHGSPDHFSLRLQAAGLSRWQTVLLAWTAGGVLAMGAVFLRR